MDWTTYGVFVLFVSVIILIPGPDVAVTIKNALVGGRRQGAATVVGIACASLLQSTAAVTGLSVLVTRAEPVFLAVKWMGAVYLCVLAAQALRSAWVGRYPSPAVTEGTFRPALGSVFLGALIIGVDRARSAFATRRVRLAMDTVTGVALLGFGARLAAE